jgi:hypothetical protein
MSGRGLELFAIGLILWTSEVVIFMVGVLLTLLGTAIQGPA